MSNTITIRLGDYDMERLDRLARATQRGKSVLAAEAVRTYLDSNGWQIGEIQAALIEADAGHFASCEDVSVLAEKWAVKAG
jgi:predicted transcriptional regulator